MASPTFIAKGTFATTSTASVAPTYPASIQAGDILYCLAVSSQATSGSISMPAGWTDVQAVVGVRNGAVTEVGSVSVFRKIADGTETGTVTVSRLGSTGLGFGAQIYQFRGTKINEESSSVNSGIGQATITWNPVTVNAPYRTLISFVGIIGASAVVDPGGWTTMGNHSGAGVALHGYYKLDQSTDGSFTTTDGTGVGWCTVQISIFNIAGRSFIVN